MTKSEIMKNNINVEKDAKITSIILLVLILFAMGYTMGKDLYSILN